MLGSKRHPRKHDITDTFDHKTTEMDTAKSLKPDGTGGVAWGTDITLVDISCSAFRNAVQSIPINAWTPIRLNDEDFDTDDMHDIAIENTKIKIPTDKGGPYLVIAKGTFLGNPNNIRGISIQKNGAPTVGTAIVQENFTPVGNQAAGPVISRVVELAGDDEIEVYVYQSTANPLNILAGNDRTFLQVIAQRGV